MSDVPTTSFVGFDRGWRAPGTVLARDGDQAVAGAPSGARGADRPGSDGLLRRGRRTGRRPGHHPKWGRDVPRHGHPPDRRSSHRAFRDRGEAACCEAGSRSSRGGSRAPCQHGRHHTVTHILHRTLKDVLGEHRAEGLAGRAACRPVRLQLPQRPEPRRAREDPCQINRHVLENCPVGWQVMDIDQARQAGAVAIFGEKYGNQVRVVDIGGWSKELCGGTHVHRSATSARRSSCVRAGLASGIRRVEVLAGEPAFNYAWEQQGGSATPGADGWRAVDQLEAKLAALRKTWTTPAARRSWSSSSRPAARPARGLGGPGE